MLCGAVELFVMCTVPPQVTVSDVGENAYSVPLLTIASDVDEVLFGQAVGAVDVGFGLAVVVVTVG